MTMTETKTAYNPGEVEQRWTEYWFDNKLFDLNIDEEKPSFSIALPPPNITGSLHLGHALNGTLQDILIRWKRMQGYNVLWQPGTDHAGISTQMVVERQLKKEGTNRHQLGREAFIEKVWEWRADYGNRILNQYRRLGVSFNWDRMAFTMDGSYVRAINRVFVSLYRGGFIYRGNRVNNWCPRCQTSLSDLEVEHIDTKGHLYHIRYPLEIGNQGLTVATTRPESMFGDVAVAVHPDDERYKKFIGNKVILPLTGRSIPVIADSYVEREFGTGALKITPAHDANDWEVGNRHELTQPVVIDLAGHLLDNKFVPEQFRGMERFAARKLVVEELKEKGFLQSIEDYEHGLGNCERCHTIIEPMLSDQWYVKMKELAEPAIEVVEEQRIQFIPERYAATYLDWMKNIRDWCISRQLWWGHRIPIWTCVECGSQDAFEESPAVCNNCSSESLEQDTDVLDTWFSSALWPFATLGWPDETKELKHFYPTSVLSTAREIINLWVARMIFQSMKFVGTIPFKHVLIHPVIQTADGKRMSKSKGNAIDPLVMIDKYGADANRFWFASIGVKGDQDVRFREDRLEEYKRFSNKIWNAARFIMNELDGRELKPVNRKKLTLPDRWILNQFNIMLKECHEGLRGYDFDNLCRAIYEFTWDELCDWYLEIAKIQWADKNNIDCQTAAVLQYVFEGLMRALHPIMPFITEEVWQKLPKSEYFSDFDSVMFAPYPREDAELEDDEAVLQMGHLIRTIRAIRNIRQTYNVPAGQDAAVFIFCSDDRERHILDIGKPLIERLTRVNPLTIAREGETPAMAARETISSSCIVVPLANLIDIEKSRKKLHQRQEAIEKDLNKVNQILENKDFRLKAPKAKVEGLESQLKDLEGQMLSVESQLKVLERA